MLHLESFKPQILGAYSMVHLGLIIICGCVHVIHPKTGSILFSAIPSLSIVVISAHFVFVFVPKWNGSSKSLKDNITTEDNNQRNRINNWHLYYYTGIIMFVIACLATIFVVKVNGKLFWCMNKEKEIAWISDFLKFPFKHSLAGKDSDGKPRITFHYAYQFLVVILGPIAEEMFKFVCILLSFAAIQLILKFGCIKSRMHNSSSNSDISGKYFKYCNHMKFLMLTYIAICISAAFAMYENFWYLMFCEWSQISREKIWNEGLCFSPIKSAAEGNIRGIARGIFTVPMHCMTAVLIANLFYWWIRKIPNSSKRSIDLAMKCIWSILLLPISLTSAVFFHSNFNYWLPMGCSILILGILNILVVLVIGRRYHLICKVLHERKESQLQMMQIK